MAGPSDEKKSLAPPVLRSGLTPTAKPSLTGPSKSFFLRPAPFCPRFIVSQKIIFYNFT